MGRDTYDNKTLSLIIEMGAVQLQKDPTDKYNEEVKIAVAKTSNLFGEGERQYLHQMNPLPPLLYCLPKTHKKDIPMRPIISFNSAPSEKLAKRLVQVFYSLCDFNPTYSLRNSDELIQKMNNPAKNFPTSRILASLDIQNMFPSIPPQDVLRIFEIFFRMKKVNPVLSEEFIGLLSICLRQSYFKFKGNFYSLCSGLVMGSAISPLAASLFMDYLECKFIMSTRNPFVHKIDFYARYVDDVIISFSGTMEELQGLYEYVNSCHPTVKFQIETEDKGALKYLDLEVERRGDSHSYRVYRKPSASDTMIPSDSYHHTQYKLAGFTYMVNRLINLPLSQADFEAEVRHVKHMAAVNGYKDTLVENILEKRYKKKVEKEMEDNPGNTKGGEARYISIPYIKNLSEKVGRMLGKIGVKTAYRSKRSLKACLPSTKDVVPSLDRSGVYRAACVTCGASYVGQSGRKLRTRMREHLTRNDSEMKKHIAQEGHDCRSLDVELLHQLGKGRKMDMLEQVEIKVDLATSSDNLNRKKGENLPLRHVPGVILPHLGRIKNQSSSRRTRVSIDQL